MFNPKYKDSVNYGAWCGKPSWQMPRGSHAQLGAQLRESAERSRKQWDDLFNKRAYVPAAAPQAEKYSLGPMPPVASSYSGGNTSSASSVPNANYTYYPPKRRSLWPGIFRYQWWIEESDLRMFLKAANWLRESKITQSVLSLLGGGVALGFVRTHPDVWTVGGEFAPLFGAAVAALACWIATLLISWLAAVWIHFTAFVFAWGLRLGVIGGAIYGIAIMAIRLGFFRH